VLQTGSSSATKEEGVEEHYERTVKEIWVLGGQVRKVCRLASFERVTPPGFEPGFSP
jgi:hypothetical protein